MFYPVRLLNQKLYLASDEAFKKASCVAPETWYLQWVQIWRDRWPLFLLNHLRALLSDIPAVCTELYASHSISRSVPQQSVAVFNKFWKSKLTNSFNYCSQKTLPLKLHHCRVKLVLLFRLDTLALSVIATATWLGGCPSQPVLYQND